MVYMKVRLMKKFRLVLVAALVMMTCASALNVYAQEKSGTAPAQTETVASVPAKAPVQGLSLLGVIINSGFFGIIVWMLLFGSTVATIGLIIDGVLTIKENKIMPPDLINAVHASLENGDLTAAVDACNQNPGPLSNILQAAFHHVSDGFDVIMDSVSTSADLESEKMMQRVNYLNLQGVLAPMLGLIGTVIGMAGAFGSLGTTTGAEKTQLLALSLSQAIYTTAAGLLIAVPAIIGFTILRNKASKIILEMESLTYELVKVLKGAEIVEEEDDAAGGR